MLPSIVPTIIGFRIALLETEGNAAGLSEVEAFVQRPEREGKFLKLMDMDGNFVYRP